MIGDPLARGRGVGPRAIWLGCLYAFDRLKAGQVRAGIDRDNRTSVRAFEKSGFRFTTGDKIEAWKDRL